MCYMLYYAVTVKTVPYFAIAYFYLETSAVGPFQAECVTVALVGA